MNQININDNIMIEQEKMENGEKRFRLKYLDESGVSITTNESKAYWQNAHYHKFGNELYVIQKGKVILAVQEEKNINYKILEHSDTVEVNRGIKHNLFLFPNTVIYNIKFGKIVSNDWNKAIWLDEQCKNVDIKKIL